LIWFSGDSIKELKRVSTKCSLAHINRDTNYHYTISFSQKMIYVIDTQSKKNVSMSTLDSKQYKEGQRQGWDSVANGWQKWWKITEIAAEKVSWRLIEHAKIKRGSRVLDIATGIGEPAITAAKQVGDSGHVLATDISSQMLSIAKQRAISLGLEWVIEFKVGDAEAIDLPASTFDAALCRFGLMFLPDLRTGLSNIYRSLVDGGRLAAAVWASPDRVPFIALALNRAMKETKGPPLPPAGAPGPFSLSNENMLRNSLIESGFKDVIIERMDVTFNFDSAEVYTSFVYETAAPVQAMLANQQQQRREEILKAISESAREYAENDTPNIRMSNEAICVVGRK
jgi:ubiquinone/menaquinone biosynthesis C-methylase UbiE